METAPRLSRNGFPFDKQDFGPIGIRVRGVSQELAVSGSPVGSGKMMIGLGCLASCPT